MPRVPTEKELLEGLDKYSAHADDLANLIDKEWGLSPDQGKQDDEPAKSPLDRLRGSVKHYDQPLEPSPDWDEWFDGDGVSDEFMTNREQSKNKKR